MAASERADDGLTAGELLMYLIEELGEGLDTAPTFQEFLDVLAWSAPEHGDSVLGGLASPVSFTATLASGRPYRSATPSRVRDLGDAVFVAATDFLAAAVPQGADPAAADAAQPDAVPPDATAATMELITRLLHEADPEFADVSAADIAAIAVRGAKNKATRLTVGDIVAIPAIGGGFHLTVVLARNSFGTALGILRGVHRRPAADPQLPLEPSGVHVYTDEQLVKQGEWQVVGRDAALLAGFAAEPEIYHAPRSGVSVRGSAFVGPNGAAETAGGVLRQIDAEEAARVGLTDGTYRQVRLGEYLPNFLADTLSGELRG